MLNETVTIFILRSNKFIRNVNVIEICTKIVFSRFDRYDDSIEICILIFDLSVFNLVVNTRHSL